MVLQRAEDSADRKVHLGRWLDRLEHDHAAALEGVVDLGAHRRIGQQIMGDALDERSEGKIVTQIANRDASHPSCSSLRRRVHRPLAHEALYPFPAPLAMTEYA